ncbi:MAG TPA: hypothetical protein VEB21_08115 [Terriglobales bacterium]|nr:hypothetical protein [Terriglobales bacterium]
MAALLQALNLLYVAAWYGCDPLVLACPNHGALAWHSLLALWAKADSNNTHFRSQETQ